MKTHNQTGLKYLGQTRQDPYTYRGSGIRWVNHIKKHGNDVSTEILKICSSYDEAKEFGKYYSKKLNIVESLEFANLVPESGHEFRLPSDFDDVNKRRSKTLSGEKRKWVTNGHNNRLLGKDEMIPEGYYLGRAWPEGKTVSQETKNKMRSAASNRPKLGNTLHKKFCEHCSKEFSVMSGQKQQRFCSRKCSAQSRKLPQNPNGRNQYSK